MPDFLHWALCGSRVAEFTIASTSQCLHPLTRNWAHRPAEEVRPAHAHLPEDRAARHHGWARCAPASRSAPVCARSTSSPRPRTTPPPPSPACRPPTPARPTGLTSVPAPGRSWASRSTRPRCPPRTQELNLTNEGGLDGTYRLLKNIMGLWLVQQCKRAFDAARPEIRIRPARADGRQGPGAPLHRQSRRPALPQPARHAQGHPGLLPRDPAARAEDRRRTGPLRLRKPRAQVSRSARLAGGTHRQPHRSHPHRGRRLARAAS